MIARQPVKTNANVPTNSAASTRASGRLMVTSCGSVRGSRALREQLVDQRLYALVELVADPPDRLQVLAGRVVERPILVALSRVDGAGIAAAHRDHHVGGAHDLVGERLGELLAHVDAQLLEERDGVWVDLGRRGRARRADVDPPLRAELQEACSHLAAAGVL